jgi:uncharacterized protein
MSLATIIKKMSTAINDEGDEYYDKIPDTRNAVAQYIELYSMSGEPDDFEKFVDFNYTKAIILVRVNDGNSKVILNILDKIEEMTKDDENVTLIGGHGVVEADMIHSLIKGQIYSLLAAIMLVTILMMMIFRSFKAGIIAALPLIIAIIILFGLMGILGIKLDAATTLLTSVMIGVGIDYTIHFLWRYKEERQNGLIYRKAVIKTLTTTGKGITFNALSVIVGFSTLPFSSFLPIKFFGFLIIISIFICLIGALVIVPSLVLLWKPKFLEPKIIEPQQTS